ncbi:SGNH/GDSL hydrolase family protein [Spirosoma radiotolerans]|uniref:G-D-S-L family lipolytic protein n=1 Tax=Spirosoma radiotolerans TaxID=1379870 RepID=A0A0E3ZSG8_9BACT|nr:SGNH/GDSL hydrolase family protein [Spirosoma radiotolerans]AKD54364.1 G-D-S-L family lipolytic protein [Spirosoma radiotolerans]
MTYLLLLVSQLVSWCFAQSPFPANVRRVVFIGNSITYAGAYVVDIDAYFTTHYSQQAPEFINVGLPSETVSGLSEEGHADGKFPRPDLHTRLARVLALTKPDLVFACYGMNDGIYLPFDESRFQKFKEGINWLHEEVIKSGAKIIHLTPPIFDELKGGHPGYAAVLDRYTDWLLAQKTASTWDVIDIHYPMKQYLDAHRKVDSSFAIDGFALAEDGVHPGAVGHWIIAKSILLGLGEKAVAKAPTVAAAIGPIPNTAQIISLVTDRQNIMKDAWLTTAGHDRPGMKTGLPLKEAKVKAASIDAQIKALIH